MKPRHIPIFLLFCTAPLHAATLTVDNNPGSVAMFQSFGAAHDAASDGDTILVKGSETDYGTHILYKRLNIVGPGYNLATDRNNIPGITRLPAKITLGFRTSSTGSASGSSAKGLDVTVTGSDVWGDLQSPNGSQPAGGITVDGCYVRSPLAPLTSRYIIRRSLIHSVSFGRGTGAHVDTAAASGSVIQNCLAVAIDITREVQNITVDRCTFVWGAAKISAPNSITNCVYWNGGKNPSYQFDEVAGPPSVSHCLFINNDDQIFSPVGPGVVKLTGDVARDSVFAGTLAEIPLFQLRESAVMLKAGSPAIGIASDGGDLGAFGGSSPYKISGVPPVPKLTHLVVPPTATSTSGLRFEVEAQAFGE